MSAQTQNPQNTKPGQIISINPGNTETDNLLGLSQQIEAALAAGRDQIRKLRGDILAMQARHQQALLEAERKFQEGQNREQLMGQTLNSHQQTSARRERILSADATAQRERADGLQNDLGQALRQMDQARTESRQKQEASAQRDEQQKAEVKSLRSVQDSLKATIAGLQNQHTQLQGGYEKSQSEIALYKNSWAQVLKMERDARAYLAAKAEMESRIRGLETRNEDLLTEAKSRIRELESAKKTLTSQLEQSRKEAAACARRLESEQHAAAQERANAGCALRAAEEERARSITAQNTVAQVRELFQAAVNQAREKSKTTVKPAEPTVEIQVSDLNEDFERISSSRAQLETERDNLKADLARAIQEMGAIKEVSDRMPHHYPLRDLLSYKETELTNAVRALNQLPEDSPARAKAEEVVETLAEQRDQLAGILHEDEPDLT